MTPHGKQTVKQIIGQNQGISNIEITDPVSYTHLDVYKRQKQINEELLDSAVAEVIVKLVSNPKFAAMMQERCV